MRIFKPLIFFTISTLIPSCVKEYESPVDQCNINFVDSSSFNPNNNYYKQLIEDFQLQGIPGTVVLIKKPGEPLWISGSGRSNLDKNIDLFICDKFHIASITKTFVAVCAFKLIEENKLKLDEILTKVLPEMKDKIANADRVTIKQLLNHTSGIPDFNNETVKDLNQINNPYYPYSDEDFLKMVYNVPARFEPGTRWEYSNTNYLLLGKVIESIENKSLQDIMQERIFSPLGMTSTYISRRSSKDVIRGYSDYYGSGKIMDITCYTVALDGSACGGMISTAHDLHLFVKALFIGTLLSANSIKLMKETVPIPPDDMLNKTIGFDQCGLGIMRLTTSGGHTGWGHSGNMSGFSGQRMCYFPDIDTYFILLTNRGWDNDEIGQLLWPYTWTNIFEKMVNRAFKN